MSGSPSHKSRSAVAALAQAALALPGVAAAQVQTDYLFSWYQEADLPRERVGVGATERYDIKSHLFRLVAPRGETRYGVNLTYETMSGASPWYVQPGADGPIQQMSGASIREERIAADVSATLPLGAARLTVLGGVSDEDDYESASGGLAVERPSADDAVTWSAGVRYSADRLKPTQGAVPTGTRADEKTSTNGYAGVALVLDRRTLVQFGGSLSYAEGYLSDPYKQVYVQNLLGPGIPGTQFDRRPDQRTGWSATAKLRRHVGAANAALHLDYRFYRDDWEVESHTTSLAWHQRFLVDWVLAPSVRYYSQGAAAFYSPWFASVPADGHMSSDYRLSPFGALGLRLDLDGSFGALGLGFGVEHYDADVRYANGPKDVANPGLVEYLSYQAKVRYRF
jgi:hypothetical protein